MPGLPPYCCPRCKYDTGHKTSIRNHFYKKTKPCPAVGNDIVLTDEIKEYVMANRIYRVKDDTKIINQTINNYNTMNNYIGNMDVVDKINKLTQYKQINLNRFEDTCIQTFERDVDRLECNTFNIRESKPDFMRIINYLTDATDSRNHKLQVNSLNCLYDSKKKKLRLFDGTWEEFLENDGLETIANIVVDNLLEAYELFIIRKLYGKSLLSGEESNELRAYLKEYYTLIACFDIKPYSIQRIMNNEEFDIETRREVFTNLGELYEKTNDGITKAHLKDMRKQMLDIIKANTNNNVNELDKVIISMLKMQEDFKQIILQQSEVQLLD